MADSHAHPYAKKSETKSKSRSRKRRIADVVLPQRVRDLVPESRAYMELVEIERHMDMIVMRKHIEMQEAVKKPTKIKRKLRLFISHTFSPARLDADDAEVMMPHFELHIEGRLLDDTTQERYPVGRSRRKFTSFFKRVIVELLDKSKYGPDQHLIEWTHSLERGESDGFSIRRFGDETTKCIICLFLDYQPEQATLEPRLARVLGMHTATRPAILSALWQYVKTHKLQDPSERQYLNFDKYLEQIFGVARAKFSELPTLLNAHVTTPDPIIINYEIVNDPAEQKKQVCYDVDVDVDDPLRHSTSSVLMSTASQQEIVGIVGKIHETVDQVNQLKTRREFFSQYAKHPQDFINQWLVSQSQDLQVMQDTVGNPEAERKADYYCKPWANEAVCRYFYRKIQTRRAELEQALGMRQ
ncbi:SWI/SNF-related matrix-associated actin-dependent regulator of chromatin subfamily D member 1-like [Sycon ciliatum]|uniref:SWI/SNF-related matrix-associated actin-dependent regulator of chromatin subfamily D member 1-like n=1 Tax=Sycon ciliatum TaxID=27933 RepID=UPI0020A98F85|eukprot:scpid59235/ scgid25073/ SWI/SNF-related matrix-associated actin-dependent regulator of chromatin subfamily D member 1; 60 kDa BRG-1/Brm-associated factor subunit A; BRG1-associated factor 60A; SWI/SNF complex 60 kDa subunit